MGASVAIALVGIGFAYLKYMTNVLPSNVISKDNFFYKLLVNKYYMDEFYHYTLIVPTHAIARAALTFDQKVVDGAVNGVAWVSMQLGKGLRHIQTGYVQNYALYMVIGLVVLLIWSIRILGLF
jgi:NADH-quinone oxidoreductase subunit L